MFKYNIQKNNYSNFSIIKYSNIPTKINPIIFSNIQKFNCSNNLNSNFSNFQIFKF